jgi:hypothetical protein
VTRSDAFVVPVRTVRRLLIALMLVVLAALVVALYPQLRDRLQPGIPIDRNAYQAVFLTTNQVYFGKVEIDGDNYLLTDVFYLSQPDTGAASQLVKRGGEPHGPREPMIVPSRSVLFIENLRDDSPVTNAIKAYKSGQTSTPATTTPVPTSAPTGTARPSATR